MTSNYTPIIDSQIGSSAIVGSVRPDVAWNCAGNCVENCASRVDALPVLLMDLGLLPLRGK